MKKILLCEGCSWTAGSLGDDNNVINPELADVLDNNLMHWRNDDYRLPRLWPHKLGKLLNVNVKNVAVPGSSNDTIVRRTINNVLSLLKQYNGDEIFVIIGWTSPERKDFYHKDMVFPADANWFTLRPAEIKNYLKNKDNKHLHSFFTNYGKYFWNREEYMSRYINHNLYLHYFLESYGIGHLFYSAFYEGEHSITDITEGLISNVDSKEKESAEEFFKIYSKVFKDISFRKYVMETVAPKNTENIHSTKFFKDHHPTEIGHQMWAEELYNDLKDIIC